MPQNIILYNYSNIKKSLFWIENLKVNPVFWINIHKIVLICLQNSSPMFTNQLPYIWMIKNTSTYLNTSWYGLISILKYLVMLCSLMLRETVLSGTHTYFTAEERWYSVLINVSNTDLREEKVGLQSCRRCCRHVCSLVMRTVIWYCKHSRPHSR